MLGCWLCNYHQNLSSSDEDSDANDELNDLREEFVEVSRMNERLVNRVAALEGGNAVGPSVRTPHKNKHF